MRLFIAEKPDLAKAIVDGLGGGSRKDGYWWMQRLPRVQTDLPGSEGQAEA